MGGICSSTSSRSVSVQVDIRSSRINAVQNTNTHTPEAIGNSLSSTTVVGHFTNNQSTVVTGDYHRSTAVDVHSTNTHLPLAKGDYHSSTAADVHSTNTHLPVAKGDYNSSTAADVHSTNTHLPSAKGDYHSSTAVDVHSTNTHLPVAKGDVGSFTEVNVRNIKTHTPAGIGDSRKLTVNDVKTCNTLTPVDMKKRLKSQPIPKPVAMLTFDDIDKRARNVPSSVKRTVPALVQYLTEGVTDQKLQVRAFFIWIADNIRYDIDGYFGRSKRVSCEADSVLKHGKSVCQGYASLMEAFCTAANIKVVLISGFSKGMSCSPERCFTSQSSSNHAWNAVCINNTWFLMDATWGAGYVNSEGQFVKKFNEFFFFTEPEKFVNAHFPFMNGDLEASNKWQLLDLPITLQQFNDAVLRKPEAYKLRIEPLSHKNGVIDLKNEATLSFSVPSGASYICSSKLMLNSEFYQEEVPRATFVACTDNGFSVRLHPRVVGTYTLHILGNAGEKGELMSGIFQYTVVCTEVNDSEFQFPYAYAQSLLDKCVIVAPAQYYLKANTEVMFELLSPLLNEVIVDKVKLHKSGTTFKGCVQVGKSSRSIGVFGKKDSKSRHYNGLYKFEVK